MRFEGRARIPQMKRAFATIVCGYMAVLCILRRGRVSWRSLPMYGWWRTRRTTAIVLSSKPATGRCICDCILRTCPESVATTDADAKRVREQARYYGITDAKKIF